MAGAQLRGMGQSSVPLMEEPLNVDITNYSTNDSGHPLKLMDGIYTYREDTMDEIHSKWDNHDSELDAHWDFEDLDYPRLPPSNPLRSNRALNRGNRGAPDHDIMEGLPVRQWRKQNIVVSTKAPKEESPLVTDPTNRWRELPMPRGSELYSPMSQALLRAARRGQISQQQQAKQHGEEKDLEEEEKKAPEPDVGIATTKWAQIAREQERPELEFLAKRRKGLPSIHSDPVTAAPMKMVKVKKVDAEGNATVFDVLAPEGAVVEGEIVKDEEVPTEAPAPGTVVEGVGVANEEGIVVAAIEPVVPTPQRRAPPRPKRKAKGPGRGRKKKKEYHAPAAGTEAVGSAEGATDGLQPNGDTLKVPDPSGDVASGTDVEMEGNSPAREGEEGTDDDDDEEGDASDMEAPTRSVSPMKSTEPHERPQGSNTTNPPPETKDGDQTAAPTEHAAESSAPPIVDDAMDVEPTNAAVALTVEGAPTDKPAASTESASETIPATAPVLPQDPLTAPMDGVTTSNPLPTTEPTEHALPTSPEPIEPTAEPIPTIVEPPLSATLAPDAPVPEQNHPVIESIQSPLPAEDLTTQPVVPPAVAEPPIDLAATAQLAPPVPIEPVVEDASAPEPLPLPVDSLQPDTSAIIPPAEASTEVTEEAAETVAPPAPDAEPTNE